MEIRELEQKRAQLRAELYEIDEEIKRKKQDSYDYTSKFVDLGEYGYMLVNYQSFISKPFTASDWDSVRLKGVRLFFDLLPDVGSVHFDCDADIKIPYSDFIHNVHRGVYKEITEEEFRESFNKSVNFFLTSGRNNLDSWIEYWKVTK